MRGLGLDLDLTQRNLHLERFRNYCGLIKVAKCGFPWEKTTKRPFAFPDFLRAALTEGNDVRLSLRKAACSSWSHQAPQEIRGSVYTNCETALKHYPSYCDVVIAAMYSRSFDGTAAQRAVAPITPTRITL